MDVLQLAMPRDIMLDDFHVYATSAPDHGVSSLEMTRPPFEHMHIKQPIQEQGAHCLVRQVGLLVGQAFGRPEAWEMAGKLPYFRMAAAPPDPPKLHRTGGPQTAA